MWYGLLRLFFFQAEDGIRDLVRSRGLGDVYKRQTKEAAARLHMHRNGVRYRLNRFEELVGRRLAVPTQLAEIHVALQAATILGLSAPPSSSP